MVFTNFVHLMEAAITNAFILYKEIGDEKITHKEFRRRVFQGLLSRKIIQTSLPTKRKAVEIGKHKPKVMKEIRLHGLGHILNKGTSRRCAKCSTKKNPVRTIYVTNRTVVNIATTTKF